MVPRYPFERLLEKRRPNYTVLGAFIDAIERATLFADQRRLLVFASPMPDLRGTRLPIHGGARLHWLRHDEGLVYLHVALWKPGASSSLWQSEGDHGSVTFRFVDAQFVSCPIDDVADAEIRRLFGEPTRQ